MAAQQEGLEPAALVKRLVVEHLPDAAPLRQWLTQFSGAAFCFRIVSQVNRGEGDWLKKAFSLKPSSESRNHRFNHSLRRPPKLSLPVGPGGFTHL